MLACNYGPASYLSCNYKSDKLDSDVGRWRWCPDNWKFTLIFLLPYISGLSTTVPTAARVTTIPPGGTSKCYTPESNRERLMDHIFCFAAQVEFKLNS